MENSSDLHDFEHLRDESSGDTKPKDTSNPSSQFSDVPQLPDSWSEDPSEVPELPDTWPTDKSLPEAQKLAGAIGRGKDNPDKALADLAKEQELGGDPFVRLHDALLSEAQTPKERAAAERSIKRFGETRAEWMGELHGIDVNDRNGQLLRSAAESGLYRDKTPLRDNVDLWLAGKLEQQKYGGYEVGHRSRREAKQLDIFGQVTVLTPPEVETLDDQQANIAYSERVLRQLGALKPDQTIASLEAELPNRRSEGPFFDGNRKAGNLGSRIPGVHLDVDTLSGKITAGLHKPAMERILGKANSAPAQPVTSK